MPDIKFKSEDGRTLSYQTQGAAPTDVEIWEMYKLSRPPDKVAEIEARYMSRLSPGQARTFTISGLLPGRDIQVPFSRPHTMPAGGPGVGMPLETTEAPEGAWEAALSQPGQVVTQQQIEARQTADPRTMTSWIEPPTPGQPGSRGYVEEVVATAPATTGFMTGVVPGAVAGVASPLYGKGREDIGQKLEHVEQKLETQVREGQGFWNAWGKNITDDAGEFMEAMDQMAPAMERWHSDQAKRPAGEGFVEGVERGFEFGMAVPEQIYSEFAALGRSPIDYLTTNPVGTLTVLAPIASSLVKAGYLAASFPVMKLIERSRRIKAGESAEGASRAASETAKRQQDLRVLTLDEDGNVTSVSVHDLHGRPVVEGPGMGPIPRATVEPTPPADPLALPGGTWPVDVPQLPRAPLSGQQAAMEAAVLDEFVRAHPPQGGITGRLDDWILKQRMEQATTVPPRVTRGMGLPPQEARAIATQALDATPAQLAEHFQITVKEVAPRIKRLRRKYAEDMVKRAKEGGALEVIPLPEQTYIQISEGIQAKARVYPPGMQRPAVTPPEPVAPPKPPPVVPRTGKTKPIPKTRAGEGEYSIPKMEAERPWGPPPQARVLVDDVVERANKTRSSKNASSAATGAGVEAVELGVEIVEPGKHAITRPKRLQLGLNVEIQGAETLSGWVDDAIREGYNITSADASRARVIADQVLDSPRPLSKIEEVGLAMRRHQMERTYDDLLAQLERAKEAGADPTEIARITRSLDDVLAEFDVVTRASELGGTEWGRAGVARQRDIRTDFSKAGLRRTAEKAKKGALTPEEQAIFNEASEKMLPLVDELKRLKVERGELSEALEAISEGTKTGSPSRVKQLEEAIDAIDSKIAKVETDLVPIHTRLGMELAKVLPPGDLAVKMTFGVLEALKTLAASIDLSYLGRQAAHVTFNPRRWRMTTSALKDSVKMWREPEFYQKFINELSNTPQGKTLSEKGLVFTDISKRKAFDPADAGRLNNAEESIRSPIGEIFQAIEPSDVTGALEALGSGTSIPASLIRSGGVQFASDKLAKTLNVWGDLITGSNRAYTGYLNSIRFELAKNLLRMDKNGESPLSMNDQLFLIDHVNKMTGRGTMFGTEATHSGRQFFNTANVVFFAPQLKLAQIQAPLKWLDVGGKFGKGGIRARAMVARDIAEPVATRLALMWLAEQNHADVGWDLTDGTRWGKIGYRVGSWNTAVDLWGGANSPYRLLLETAFAKGRYTRRGDFIEYGEGNSAAQAAFGHAMRYWTAPGPSALTNLLFMEDVFGYNPESKPLHIAETIGGLGITISGANAIKLMSHGLIEEGLPGLAAGTALAGLEIMGMATSADFTKPPLRRVLEGMDLLSRPEYPPELIKKSTLEYPVKEY